MQILQIANDYLGSGLYKLLFAALEEKGHQHTIFVPMKNSVEAHQPKKDVYVVPCFDDIDRVLFYRKQKSMLRWIESNLQMDKFDVIHAHTVFSGGYSAYQLHKRYGIPYIVAVRDTDMNVFFKYMVHLRKTGVEILRNASKIIFLSPAYQKQLPEKYLPEKYREEIISKSDVIPNGIDKLFFENKGTAKTINKNEINLIYVGLLNSRKNLELTVDAVNHLRHMGKNVSLTVVGTIKEDKYNALLKENSYINYYERCPQKEVIEHMRKADIFVMPSHRETFGLVYAEAMSQGLPVIYTKGQGFDGQFDEGTVGYSVSDTDAKALANTILKTAENYEFLSQNCIDGIDKFDWNFIGEKYDKIYKEITE